MDTVLMAIAALAGVVTLVGLVLHGIAWLRRGPAWHERAARLEPVSIDSLGDRRGWVWISAPAGGSHEGVLHGRVSWSRTVVVSTSPTRPVLSTVEVPETLVVGGADGTALPVRVGVVERASERHEKRERNPFGTSAPGELNTGVEVTERAILPGEQLQVIGKLESVHGTRMLRAHYDDALVWRGSASALRAAVRSRRPRSADLAPHLVHYGGFVCIIALLLYSMVA